ncbi:hypothetical protein WN48_11353 [Eufriesea mexicana]|uniref:Uncharacterized protein n=1 Tax=Eufriesea mexicana TaxID=516756 RepID=A0A310SS78_9HYME|nr:hypothetical protein WN48_11353 [Eufriesea mexicana]
MHDVIGLTSIYSFNPYRKGGAGSEPAPNPKPQTRRCNGLPPVAQVGDIASGSPTFNVWFHGLFAEHTCGAMYVGLTHTLITPTEVRLAGRCNEGPVFTREEDVSGASGLAAGEQENVIPFADGQRRSDNGLAARDAGAAEWPPRAAQSGGALDHPAVEPAVARKGRQRGSSESRSSHQHVRAKVWTVRRLLWSRAERGGASGTQPRARRTSRGMRGATPKKTLPVVDEGECSEFAGAVGISDLDGSTSSSWEPPGKAAKRPRRADVERLIPLPPGAKKPRARDMRRQVAESRTTSTEPISPSPIMGSSRMIPRHDSSVKRVIFASLTLSSRGVWSKQCFESLYGNNILKFSDAKIISTRALIGRLNALNIFSHRTSVRLRWTRHQFTLCYLQLFRYNTRWSFSGYARQRESHTLPDNTICSEVCHEEIYGTGLGVTVTLFGRSNYDSLNTLSPASILLYFPFGRQRASNREYSDWRLERLVRNEP